MIWIFHQWEAGPNARSCYYVATRRRGQRTQRTLRWRCGFHTGQKMPKATEETRKSSDQIYLWILSWISIYHDHLSWIIHLCSSTVSTDFVHLSWRFPGSMGSSNPGQVSSCKLLALTLKCQAKSSSKATHGRVTSCWVRAFWNIQHLMIFPANSTSMADWRIFCRVSGDGSALIVGDILRADAPRRLRRISRPSISSQCGLESFWMGTCFRNIVRMFFEKSSSNRNFVGNRRLFWGASEFPKAPAKGFSRRTAANFNLLLRVKAPLCKDFSV